VRAQLRCYFFTTMLAIFLIIIKVFHSSSEWYHIKWQMKIATARKTLFENYCDRPILTFDEYYEALQLIGLENSYPGYFSRGGIVNDLSLLAQSTGFQKTVSAPKNKKNIS